MLTLKSLKHNGYDRDYEEVKMVHFCTRGPNPLDELEVEKTLNSEKPKKIKTSRVFEITKKGRTVAKTAWHKKGAISNDEIELLNALGAEKEETRSVAMNIRVTPAIKKALHNRAKKHCDGNLSEWLVWAALEFKPSDQKFIVSAEA